jgi:hypothetical protein
MPGHLDTGAPRQHAGPVGQSARRAPDALGPVSAHPRMPLPGPSAAATLLRLQRSAGNAAVLQRVPPAPPQVARPASGIDKMGFIDTSDGANIRTGPAEAGGQALTPSPMPPATRVFVSGTHPQTPEWWYVTAFLEQTLVRGYVQGLRVNTNLPEPMARLYQVKPGDTAEKLAVQEFKQAVRDGHDLRYYENVLLYVNREAGRAGVTGSFQDPGLLGGGANNVQLEAGRRIWLASPAYAKELEKVVPDGSFSNGMYAKVKRFVQHVADILQSVTDSPSHLDEVAGEYAAVIREHRAEIIGVVILFLTAEAASALLAASPTGVSQIIAALIQLVLAALGAAGMVQAVAQALKHGSEWLTLAWTAAGKAEQIAAASKQFLKMLVSIAMAALAWLGVKGNYATAVRIGNNIDMGGNAAFAVVGGGTASSGGAAAAAGGPNIATPLGAGGSQMVKHGEGGGGEKPTAKEPEKTAAERDWDRAEAEVKRQQAEADAANKPERTEHGAIREQERGALTADEKARLTQEIPRSQRTDSQSIVKVLRNGKGRYTVVITNLEGELITRVTDTRREVAAMSRKHGWDPPFE